MPAQHTTYSLGIDLGTTYFGACVGNQMVPIAYGLDVHRSEVRVSKSAWFLPSPADLPSQNRLHLSLAKRVLGRLRHDGRLVDDLSTIPCAKLGELGAYYDIHGQAVNPEEVSGFILGKIKAQVGHMYRGQLERVVITVPAYFSWPQRHATADAAEIAGFTRDSVELLPEPVAAVAYFNESDGSSAVLHEDAVTVVIDVGGGTTDATAVQFDATNGDHSYIVLATAGDNRLGGVDFDRALRDLVLSKAGDESNKIDRDRLLLDCEAKKRDLSTSHRVTMDIPTLDQTVEPSTVTITREEFESACQVPLGAIGRIMDDLKSERAEAERPKTVLLVGGSCAMPCVRKMCDEKFPNAQVELRKAEEAVARGAGIIASKPDIKIHGVLPRSIGIEVLDKAYSNKIIAKRNTPLPITLSHTLYTRRTNQEAVEFTILEGEEKDPSLNTEVGVFVVAGIPQSAAGTEIKIQLNIPAPGLVNATAEINGVEGSLAVEPKPRVGLETLYALRERTRTRLGLDSKDAAQEASPSGGSVEPRVNAGSRPDSVIRTDECTGDEVQGFTRASETRTKAMRKSKRQPNDKSGEGRAGDGRSRVADSAPRKRRRRRQNELSSIGSSPVTSSR